MKVIQCLFVVLSLVSLAFGVKNDEKETSRKASSYIGDIRYLYKMYQECASTDLSTCLKLKLFTIVDRVSRSNNDFKVYDGVSFEKGNEDAPVDESPLKTEEEIEASLPRSLDDKEQTLNSLIMDKIMSYFGSHTLKV